MNSLLLDVMKELLSAWRDGTRRVRAIIGTAIIFVVLGIIVVLVGKFLPYFRNITEGVAGVLGAIGGVLALTIFAFQKAKEEEKRERHIEQVEKRFQENPQESHTAWELARAKLEAYLDRNLSQVRAIFWLTVCVMIVGFTLIVVGISLVYRDPLALNASVLSAVSGVIVSFIGATFLTLYKSTMAQAATYVAILERINAVGMSVQILETIKQDAGTLKEQTTADIAKQLLVMYSDKGKA
jgi:cytochrome c biogenesis protein CcdA